MHRSELTIDLGAARRNTRRLLEVLGGAELWAVVKADAYGHGAVDVAGAVLGEGASALCVATVAEGLVLRDEFPAWRIVVMGPSALSKGGMETIAMPDSRGAQWTKLIFNAASNPVGALTGLPHGWACERRDIRELVRGLVGEGRAVADALGVELDSDPDELIDHAIEVAHDHKASMLQDVEARRPTEVDFLNGGISRFGRERGVETPLNDAIWALVKGLELSWRREEPR